MKKRIKLYSVLTFLIGFSAICCGINLVIKSNFGVSVISSVPYVYSWKFQYMTFGIWSYVVQVIPFLILVFSLKKLKLKYFFSFFMACIFGKVIDIFSVILLYFDSDTLMARSFYYIIGTVAIAFGISAWIKSRCLMQPCDVFIKEFSEERNINVGKVKTYFDLSWLSLSVVSSLLFLGEIKGVHIGTLVSALITGAMVKFFLDFQNKYIEDVSIFNKEKVDFFMEYDFFRKSKNWKLSQ